MAPPITSVGRWPMRASSRSSGRTPSGPQKLQSPQKDVSHKITPWLWCKNVVALKKYIPGDTNRSYWQKTGEVTRWFIYYKAAHFVLHFTGMTLSFFHVFCKCPTTEKSSSHQICFGTLAGLNPVWPAYLTRWGLILNSLQAAYGLALVVVACRRQCRQRKEQFDARKQERVGSPGENEGHVVEQPRSSPASAATLEDHQHHESNPKEHLIYTVTGLYWLLHSMALVLSLLVTVSYWLTVYDYNVQVDLCVVTMAVEHGLNFCLNCVDYAMVAFPVLFVHIFFIPVFLSIYALFTLFYWLSGGLDQYYEFDYLYDILNWKQWGQAVLISCVTCILSFLLAMLLLVGDYYKFKCRRPWSP